jgi:hypothetical protein
MGTITFTELVRLHGHSVASAALGFGRHYYTDGPEPEAYWLEEDIEEILGLIDRDNGRAGE